MPTLTVDRRSEQGMGYHEWLLLNEALEVEHPVFVINLANRSGEFQRQLTNTQASAHVYRL